MALGTMSARDIARTFRVIEAAAAAAGVSVDAIARALEAAAGRGIITLFTDAESSPKLAVNGGHVHIHSRVMYLQSGRDTCHARDHGCKGCYMYSGRNKFTQNVDAKARRVSFWLEDPANFTLAAVAEIARIEIEAMESGRIPAARLNGLSDIQWENARAGSRANVMECFPAVQFWDYTRIPGRIRRPRPGNYDLTFSLGADNDRIAYRALEAGMRVAVVFPTPAVPDTWSGRPCVDGNLHDFRWLEAGGVFVGLKARGLARKDDTGWVRDPGAGLELDRVPRFGRD